ncbi:hypothetical protein HMPREF3198_00271 [Winkia neuii]|nr:hypothetical protein HMPREF3198_00271 [Winkia neuii]
MHLNRPKIDPASGRGRLWAGVKAWAAWCGCAKGTLGHAGGHEKTKKVTKITL